MRRLAVLLVFPPMLASCGITGQDCSTEFRPGLVITVVSSIDGSPVTEGLRVVIESRDGSYFVEIEPPSNAASGAGERAGRYDVTVSATGYETQILDVRVPEDECHVITQSITVELTPQEIP